MSDSKIRLIERAFQADPGNLELRDELLRAGERTGKGPRWASRIMGGPEFDTFLTWNDPDTGVVHLACPRPQSWDRGGSFQFSPLLCGFDIRRRGRDLSWVREHWPLHLVWRKQAEVTCAMCAFHASQWRVLPGKWQIDGKEPEDPTAWSPALAKHQALYWVMWHPVLWTAHLRAAGLP